MPLRHVGFNALFLDPGVSGGPETYLRGLVPAIATEFPSLQLTVVTTRRGARSLRADGWTDFARIVHLPCDEGERGRRLAAEQLLLGTVARRRRFDVLHSLASIGPVLPSVPAVVTLHDVTFFRIRTFGLTTTLAMKAIVTGAARTASALISGSAAARDEACEELHLDPARFTVVHHGAGRLPDTVPTPAADIRAKLGLDGQRVVLTVGAIRPHKNQGVLVEALPSLPADVVLVLAGRPELGAEELGERARALGVAERVVTTGYLDDADLEGLWRVASCFAFPTRAEGFGLPLLEAMQRGVPAACSDIPVLREVGGDVARRFDPDDPAGAAAAVQAAMADPDAAERGRVQAQAFSWEASARGTYAAYERALTARR
ncbi:glycosyltransferase family 4 protein [Solirubrobacter soli]|uniref:glycosyltransferase family 4 protein n=1 Tax=Solirubrobacter soli TaxID=363832 RepID=UPI0003F8B1EF|nr:glycosyltransferase family 1 protein [Solirubrobacter soli]